MQVLATGGPTHYPYSQRKPSAIDFAIYKGIRAYFLSISEIHELSSGHIPLIIQYRVSACKLSRKTCILPQNVSIPQFQEAINGLVNVNMQLDTADDIDDASTAPSSNSYKASQQDSENSMAFAEELEGRFQPSNLARPEDVDESLEFLNAPSLAIEPIPHVSPEMVCQKVFLNSQVATQ